MGLIAVSQMDISVGAPLPWPIYDQGGAVLMEQGAVVETTASLEALLAAGALREAAWPAAEASDDLRFEANGTESQAALADISETGFTFQDMRLRVGDRIQLQPPANVGLERYMVRLIGYLDNATVLVTMPLENGLRVPLREKDKVVARVFTSQKAFGFTSTIERVCKIPYDYLHLSFPTTIQGSVVRTSPRVRTKLIASVTYAAESEESTPKSALIANLSAHGALVRSRKPLAAKNELLRIAFRVNLHNVDALLTVNAVVRSVFKDEAGEGAGAPMVNHGVQFQELRPNDSMILQSLIYQQMIEQPHTLA